MTPSYAVQARLIERHSGVIVRDETRLAASTVLDEAVGEARRNLADGFTVWIFRVEPDAGCRPRYTHVDTLHPVRPRRYG